jgi:hypothetical protein
MIDHETWRTLLLREVLDKSGNYEVLGIDEVSKNSLAKESKLQRETIISSPVDVLLGNVAGKNVSIRVEGLPIDTPLVYLGENTSIHAQGLPRRRGDSYILSHPTYQDVALVLFTGKSGSWFEGFAPLLDDSWDNLGRDAYREQRLSFLRMLRMADMPEVVYG